MSIINQYVFIVIKNNVSMDIHFALKSITENIKYVNLGFIK